MPNRIIKDSIHESERISDLSDFNFRLWICLITSADDKGRCDARPAIIKGHCFPLRDRVSVKDIDAGVHALAAAGCVTLYKVGGRPYLYLRNWEKHQYVKNVRPKFPGPEEADPFEESESENGQFEPENISPEKSGEIRRNSPAESESESESENESESEQETPYSPPGGGGLSATAAERRFNEFWAAYPKKTGKGAVQKKFAQLKVSDALLADMLKALEWQKASAQWTKDGGQYIPNPLTWLNQERWKDEPQAATQQTFVNPFWASMSGGPIE